MGSAASAAAVNEVKRASADELHQVTLALPLEQREFLKDALKSLASPSDDTRDAGQKRTWAERHTSFTRKDASTGSPAEAAEATCDIAPTMRERVEDPFDLRERFCKTH